MRDKLLRMYNRGKKNNKMTRQMDMNVIMSIKKPEGRKYTRFIIILFMMSIHNTLKMDFYNIYIL